MEFFLLWTKINHELEVLYNIFNIWKKKIIIISMFSHHKVDDSFIKQPRSYVYTHIQSFIHSQTANAQSVGYKNMKPTQSESEWNSLNNCNAIKMKELNCYYYLFCNNSHLIQQCMAYCTYDYAYSQPSHVILYLSLCLICLYSQPSALNWLIVLAVLHLSILHEYDFDWPNNTHKGNATINTKHQILNQ